MTKRSILSGTTPTVHIGAGRDIKVEGWEGDRVEINADGMWGLQAERRDGVIELRGGRQRHDVKVEQSSDAITISAGRDCEVRVPKSSTLKLYAGRDAEVKGVSGGIISVVASHDLFIEGAEGIGACSAGHSIDVESKRLVGDELKFTAGRHLRCHIHDVNNTKFMIKDSGGYWEMPFGEPATQVWLRAGGDVTLVIDEEYGTHLPDVVGGIEFAHSEPDQEQDLG